ncbi:hypothetical protein [Streptomyces sp. NPDC048560]|uniref:hypothetical protein n=1 Tax=Streptomyces sp. NPDC048560 TaxID=3155488 RepID=UPI0034495AED
MTVTLGGNDLGFADVITRCVLAGRSPQARVVVGRYPNLPADASTCGFSVPLAKGDVARLHRTTNWLNLMLSCRPS